VFNTTKNIPAATNQATDQLTPAAGKIPTYVREDLFRIDHNINDKWQLFGHFIHDAVSQNYATVLWNGDNYPTVGSNFGNPSYSSTIKLTGSLTPNVLVEVAFNYDGNKIAILRWRRAVETLPSRRAGPRNLLHRTECAEPST